MYPKVPDYQKSSKNYSIIPNSYVANIKRLRHRNIHKLYPCPISSRFPADIEDDIFGLNTLYIEPCFNKDDKVFQSQIMSTKNSEKCVLFSWMK